ncbi:cobalt ECF transporter T component CbiQ [Kineosporia sp. NBRC 101731]|uniref:cobalt ECF transporter T component CbiQ n=1 Tax=Kineosporia sp. NBRC 101731 TaxID=3032199 RepID=UPI0024A4941B|nr:cobalt ECF transporter T component CbiQ [Kineosporia sp. NBRC 101731]GLY32729.1 cobalt ECF transporter T component CbiQ [Kineosporia sp. NBRC 101731]
MSAPAIDVAAWASPWRRYSPGDKVLLSLGLVISALVLPTWPASVLVTVTALGLVLGPGRVPGRLLVRAARGPAAFILLGTVTIAVTWRTDGFGPTVTGESLDAAVQTLAHAVSGTSAVMLLAATTPMTDLLAWARRRGVPEAIVDIAGLVYRLLFVLLESAGAVRAAQTARLGYTSRRATLRSASMLAAATLTRAFDRARRLENGLAGRGFEGVMRTLADQQPSSRPFVATTLAGLTALAAVSLLPGAR